MSEHKTSDKQETPRTNAFVEACIESGRGCGYEQLVPLCHQLERELAMMTEAHETCKRCFAEAERNPSATLPIEPTEDMIRAGVNAWIQMYPRSPIDDCRNVYINIWKAMLKASPSYVKVSSSDG